MNIGITEGHNIIVFDFNSHSTLPKTHDFFFTVKLSSYFFMDIEKQTKIDRHCYGHVNYD